MPSTCPMVASPPPIFRSPPPCRAAAHWSRIASPDVALGISSSLRSAGRRVRRARVAAATTPPGHSLPWLLPVQMHITGPRHMASCWGDKRWLGEVWLWHVAKWKSWDPARWECENVRGMICLSATLQLSDVNHDVVLGSSWVSLFGLHLLINMMNWRITSCQVFAWQGFSAAGCQCLGLFHDLSKASERSKKQNNAHSLDYGCAFQLDPVDMSFKNHRGHGFGPAIHA